MLDFGARLYDAPIGRMHTVDRATEMFSHVSGYSFGLNNPVYNIDPTGDTTVPAQNMEPFKPERGATLLNEVVIKAKAFETLTNTSAYVGQQIMDERTGFWDTLDQLFNGNRSYMGYQVDRGGVLSPYSTPITGTPPDVGVAKIGTVIGASSKVLGFGSNSVGHLIKHRDVLGFASLSAQQAQKMLPQLRGAANQLLNSANPTLTRVGQWHQHPNALMYISGGKMLVTDAGGTFVTIIPKTSNNWYQLAKSLP